LPRTVADKPRAHRVNQGAPTDASRARRGKKSRSRSPRWAVLVTVLGVLLTVGSAAGMVSTNYFLGQLTQNIQTTSGVLGDQTVAGPTVSGKLPKGAMNLLLLGLDTRQGWATEGKDSRSDTMIILHISATHDQAYMISIPRDLVTHIPADSGMGFNGTTTKINAAYTFGSMNGRGWTGGAKLATKAVHELTGITFDGVVVIDFDGFKGILQAMGGVYMCVDKDMWSSHYIVVNGKPQYITHDPTSPPKNALWFRKGCREMAPWEALEYSRLRHSSNGDYDRQRHQQQLLRAMAKKASSAGILSSPSKIADILAAAGSSLKMDTHGVPVQDFVFGLKNLAGTDLVALKTNGGTFATAADGKGESVTSATKDLFAAARTDQLGTFVLEHPSFLISDGSSPM
jgi:LCP family protein required for cell wall assembly